MHISHQPERAIHPGTLEKRERVLSKLNASFQALGCQSPEMPDSCGSKRTFETNVFETRKKLRALKEQLKILRALSRCLQAMNLDFANHSLEDSKSAP